MSKSIKKKLMALMVAGVMAVPMASFAQDKPVLISDNAVLISEDENVDVNEKEEIKNEYMKYAGTVSEVIKRDTNISIHVNSGDKEDEYGMTFHVSDKVSLWNRDKEELIKAEDLKEGMAVEVYFPQHTPMTMSLPPQLTPSVIIVQNEEANGPTYMGEFNEDLISTENYLKLTIGEDTLIVNEKGEKLEEKDIYNKAVLVFFGASTRSIPAQTTPSKIVLLAQKEDVVVEEIEEEIDEDITEEEVEEIKEMIALRATATELGYKVKWNKDQTVELTKQNQTIVIGLGKVDYTLNKSLGRFSKAPELRDGTMYVSASVLEFMN